MLKQELYFKLKRGKHYLIKYKDIKGNTTERFIVPLYKIKKYSTCISAYCYLRNAKRNFRIDRIIDIKKVKIKKL